MTELYLTQWLHTYLLHFGALTSVFIVITVVKYGLPTIKQIGQGVLSAVILAAIVAAFSSHSHIHYLQYFMGK